MDINKILLTGVVDTKPILSKLPQSNTPVCSFTLKVEEKFLNAKNILNIRPSYFRIESLGRQAGEAFDKVRQSGRYLVDGYLRQENSIPDKMDIIKIRTFGIVADPTPESHNYKKGLEKALHIIALSRDIPSAIAALEDVINQG